jgi:Fe-S-cluster containining protein
MNTQEIKNKGKQHLNKNKKLFQNLKKLPSSYSDRIFSDLHAQVFEKTDCLTCANCCKTTSPIFREKDIERIAAYLKMSPGNFSEKYLITDEDFDKVLKQSPCPFLEEDNRCRIYEVRPAACSAYPHTNRKNILGISELTLKNSLICPAVQDILERANKEILSKRWN